MSNTSLLSPSERAHAQAVAAIEREKTRRQENVIAVVVGVGVPLGIAYWLYRQIKNG